MKNKYKKYTSILFVGVALIASNAYAEENVLPIRKEGQEKRMEFKDLRKNEVEGVKDTRVELKNNLKDEKGNLKDNLIQKRNELKGEKSKEEIELIKKDLLIKKEEMKATMEAKREEFKKNIEVKRAEVKVKIETAKEKLKTDLLKIKDAKKVETVEKINAKIAELNTKAVNNLTESITKIEASLTKIETRTSEEQARGVDVKVTLDAIVKAKASIADAKAQLLVQSGKVYTATITTETALKGSMSKMRESLNTDIKALREKVKLAHKAVVDTLQTLPKAPKPSMIEGSNTTETNTEVSDNKVESTTNTTTTVN